LSFSLFSLQFPTRNKQDTIIAEDDYKDWSTSEEDEENPTTTTPNFPELIDAITAAITELGGSVVPKLTWSVPKDATWVAVGNTLRCNTADQVLLLLKSSDRVAHDLEDALAQCTDTDTTADPTTTNDNGAPLTTTISPNNTNEISNDSTTIRTTMTRPPGGHILALRKWYDLKPGREFRCFVISGRLKGISQRDVSRKYEELESEFESIKRRIEEFHSTHILVNTNSTNDGGGGDGDIAGGVSSSTSFTYDCYVPSSSGSAVKIIDFNPAGGTTAPLLFEWEELLEENSSSIEPEREDKEEEEEVEFRIIREDVAMRPDTALYGVPYDFIDYSEGSALRSLMEQAQRGNATGDGDGDAEE
jgi:hypothetical protein